MRWFWLDRFLEFVSGQRAVAVKNVTLSEEHLPGYHSGHPMLPLSLVLEGMAQTAGMLVGEMSEFQMRLVLAKVARASFHLLPRPGDRLQYTVSVLHTGGSGTQLSATSHIDGSLQASAELFLAVLPPETAGESLFDPVKFARLLRVLRVYEVGVDAQGHRLEFPSALRAAELAAVAQA